LEYFGEEESKRCGKCDVCLNRNKIELSEFEFDFIVNQIKPLIKEDDLTIEDIVTSIDADEDKIIKVIQWLIENNKIKETEELRYKWT